MTRLHDLYDQAGQSPWLDNLRRSWITSGELARWVDAGVRGLTSNPSIFEKAIGGSDAYDEQFRDLAATGASIDDIYWELVTTDIEAAARGVATDLRRQRRPRRLRVGRGRTESGP